MAKPVCVKCRLFYKPKQNGVYFIEGMPLNGGTKWDPYKLWASDLWECKGCGSEILVSNVMPVAERHTDQFRVLSNSLDIKIQVNDC